MTEFPHQKELEELYQKMYELTNPLCSQCKLPHSCCDKDFGCHAARWHAFHTYGIELNDPMGLYIGDHPELPYMGPNGCKVPPHLRPHCTLHHCDINSLGFFRDNLALTARYFEICEEIERLEMERMWLKRGKNEH